MRNFHDLFNFLDILAVYFGIGSVDLIRVICMAAQLRTGVSTGSSYRKASKNRV